MQDKAEYLRSLLANLDANKPILVSPSMSGGFSIPFLIQNPEGLAGYVPVAPVGTEKNKAKYHELQVRSQLCLLGEIHVTNIKFQEYCRHFKERSTT